MFRKHPKPHDGTVENLPGESIRSFRPLQLAVILSLIVGFAQSRRAYFCLASHLRLFRAASSQLE